MIGYYVYPFYLITSKTVKYTGKVCKPFVLTFALHLYNLIFIYSMINNVRDTSSLSHSRDVLAAYMIF
jgi:hypothetical protein